MLDKTRSEYQLVYCSWEDPSRYQEQSTGKNITDVFLQAKEPKGTETIAVPTIRHSNLKDKVIMIKTSGISLIDPESPMIDGADCLNLQTLLHELRLDIKQDQASVRFQASFVPDGVELTVCTHNYQAQESGAPMNLRILATAAGTAIHTDHIPPGTPADGKEASKRLGLPGAPAPPGTAGAMHWIKLTSSYLNIEDMDKQATLENQQIERPAPALPAPIGVEQIYPPAER